MRLALLSALGLATSVSALAADGSPEPASDWAVDVCPYLWVASVDLKTSLPPTSSGGVDRFDTRFGGGAMLAAQVSYRSFGLAADFAWLRLNTEAIDPGPAYSTLDLQSDFIHATAALTWEFVHKEKIRAQLLAGARVWYVGNDFTGSRGFFPGFDATQDKAWADPIVGASVSYAFAKRWSAIFKGDIGGFGVAADLGAEAFAGVKYDFSGWCSATLGYRYLYEKYTHDNFNLSLDTQGFLLGLGFHF